MGVAIVVLGDMTSHGGQVISASSGIELAGKKAALLNDMASCPLHGPNAIIECNMQYEEQGRGIVADGCLTACGAVVYAGSADMEIE